MAHIEHIGQFFRHRRGQAGFTQQELAEKAGVSTTTVVRLENGDSRPQSETLAKLAEGLGIDAPPWVWSDNEELPGTLIPFTTVYVREGGRWRGYVEELPGVVAEDVLLKDARESLADAIREALEVGAEPTRISGERDEVREIVRIPRPL